MIRKRTIRILSLILAAGTLICAAAPAVCAATGPDGEPKAGLTEEEQAFAAGCGTLKVGYVQDRPPVSYKGADGEMAGISRYIFDRIAALSGFDFEYVALPDGDITYDYLTGEGFDLVTSVEYNQENKRARGILISEPYLSSRKVVVARDDLDFSYTADLTVAVSSGSQTIHKVLGASYPNFELVDYPSITDCFQAVMDGKADLTIQNQFVVEYWFDKPLYESLNVIPVMGMDDQQCFSAVVAFDGQNARTQEEGLQIIDILDKAIAKLSEDEVGSYTIQGIMEGRYELTLGDFLYRYRYAAAALGLSALVIAVLAVLLLRQRVQGIQDRADAKAKGEFLSTMSHEIRTPLNGLVGLNYLMSQRLDDPERLAGYLRQSSATADYLLHLVNDVLDMSKLQDGEVELVCRPVELEALADRASVLMRGDMAAAGLTFETETDIRWPLVLGDETRIQQVILNLLDNARKFTPAGGRVLFRMEQQLQPSGQVLTRAEVIDNGRGMSEQFQKRVFHSFAQELDTVSKGNQGTGLGLPISRHLAQLMGGELSFTSQKDKGSTFVFTFPAMPAETPAAGSELSVPADKPRVLVAEDNELNGEIMLEVLADAGFEAVLAGNGREAVETFRRFAPGTYGVILMDLLMPEMDGFQAAAAIRAMDRPDAGTVKIIACTANSSEEDRAKAEACGMDGFLAKPVDIGELMGVLAAL